MDSQKPISNQKNILYLVDKQTFIRAGNLREFSLLRCMASWIGKYRV